MVKYVNYQSNVLGYSHMKNNGRRRHVLLWTKKKEVNRYKHPFFFK